MSYRNDVHAEKVASLEASRVPVRDISSSSIRETSRVASCAAAEGDILEPF